MRTQLWAASLALAATLCLGGCPQAPAPAGDDTAADASAGGEEYDTNGNGGMSQMAGTVTARFSGGAETVMVASECVITNNGANGVVRADEGAFELAWADGTYRLVWSRDGALYQGDVTGSVQAGGGVTFEGSANGQSAQGFAVCLGGM